MSANKKNKLDWILLKTEYLTSDISLRKLAEKYNVSYNTINSRSNKEQWFREKQETQSKITAETQQICTKEAINEKIEANKRHNALYDKSIKVIDFLLEQYLEEMPRIQSGEIKKGKVTPYNMDFLLNAIQKVQKGQRLALNIVDDDVVSEEPEIMVIRGLDEDKI